MFKKWTSIIIISLLILTLAGCGGETNTPKEDKTLAQTQQVANENTKPTQEPQEPQQPSIAAKAGLGDTIQNFKKAYGPGEDKGVLYNFSNGKILIMFVDNIASNVTINHDYIAADQAQAEIKDLLPTDFKVLKNYKETDSTYTKEISLCSSEKLKSSKADYNKEGKFIIIQKSDKSDKVFATILGIGHNP